MGGLVLLVLVVLLRRSLLADKGHEIRKIFVVWVGVAVLMVLVVFLTSIIR